MADYIFNDEDNNPMIETDTDRIMKYTTYSSRAEMQAYESGAESKKEKPEDGCWNCIHFNLMHEACSAGWNNLDESYYNPDIDKRELTDYCSQHEIAPDTDPECLNYGGNEP